MCICAPMRCASVPPHPTVTHSDLQPTTDSNGRALARLTRSGVPDTTHRSRHECTSAKPRQRPQGRDEVVTAARERPDHRPDRLRRPGTCAGWWGRCGFFLEGRGCAVAGGTWAGHGQRGGLGGAHLGLRRRSCRSERSSEPGCEAGTHSRDGQGRALSSARPLGPPRHAQNVPKMRIASPVRANVPVSRRTRAQMTPHRVRIAGICGARWGVVESKGGIPDSSNGRGAR